MSNAAAEALARAREIAAKLSGSIGSELGKRKRWDESDTPGLGSRKSEKIYIPVKDYPEINFLGLLIGPKGATQKQMQDSTGAKILIRGRGASKDGGPSNTGHPDDNDELHVFIEGSEESVEKAAKEVRELLFNPEQAQRLKNEQLQRLAEINNPGGHNGSGGSESHYGPAGSDYQIELRVPNHLVGLIIGRGGENIVRIQTQLQVNCQIAKENEMKPGETLRSIVVKGPQDGVEEAKLRIEDIIHQHLNKNNPQANNSSANQQQRELDHAFVVKLPVPNDKVGIIIGRGGMTIKGIQERTKAFVQIPPGPDENDPNVRTLSIGADTKEAVDAAQMEIFMTFQSQQQNAANAYNASASALQMLVPDDRVGIIIGKGGVTVKDIQNRLRVRVQIPQSADIGTNPPMRTISIVGTPEAQQQAKYEIEMVVAGTPANGGGGFGARSVSNSNMMMMGGVADPYAAAYGAYGAANPAASAAAYGSYYDPYGTAAAAAAYSAYYGAAAAAATTPTAAAAAAAAAASGTDASSTDLTAYHTAYWQYAAYYGEAAARLYYGAWSPPEGTAPPEGITLPSDEQIAANTAAATTAAAAATTDNGSSSSSSNNNGAAADNAAYDPSTATVETAAAVTASAAATSAATDADGAEDPAAATAAWEAYQKQYKEWYEAYGKAAGADPNPPAMA